MLLQKSGLIWGITRGRNSSPGFLSANVFCLAGGETHAAAEAVEHTVTEWGVINLATA